MHLWPSTHQSHGNEDETHCVQELYVLQSKKVKFVATKSGPDVILTDNLAVKWSEICLVNDVYRNGGKTYVVLEEWRAKDQS